MISQRARYAFKALAHLSRCAAGAPMQIGDIARAESIPQPFLEQILLEMKRGGMVVSRRGKAGGYMLARPAVELTLAQVLRLVDGPVAPLPCLSRTAYRRCKDCADEENCAVRAMFAHTYAVMLAELEKTSLADFIDPTRSVQSVA